MQHLLELKNVTRLYSDKKGIKDVNLTVDEGKIVGIAGKSGSGKTTLLESIVDYTKIQSGKSYYYGELINKRYQKIIKELGYVSQKNLELEHYSILDYLLYSMSFYKIDYKNEIISYLTLFNLNPDSLLEDISEGELRIVNFINAVYHKPRLLILDEVTNGLDVTNKHLISDILKRLKSNNCTIILTSHDISFLSLICDELYVIKENSLNKVSDNFLKRHYKLINIITDKYYTYKDFKQDGISNIAITNNKISFIYKGEISKLLKFLNSLNLVDITISNPNVNDIYEDFKYEE